MARLLSVIHGEMRGSIGGNVYSRNRAGMIVRQRVTPAQRNSVAQIRSRSWLRQAVQQWCQLTPPEKESWRDFATNASRFNPLRKVNSGQYTGAQAYTSLAMEAAASDFFQDPAIPVMTLGTLVTNITVTGSTYVAPRLAPAVGLSGTFMATDGPRALTLRTASITAAGIVSATFHVDGAPTTIPNGAIEDAFGNEYGFTAWLSSSVKDTPNRPAVQFFTRLGNTGIITKAVQAPEPIGNELTVNWATGQYTSGLDYTYGLVAGSAHELTVGLVSHSGMLVVIGKEKVIIT